MAGRTWAVRIRRDDGAPGDTRLVPPVPGRRIANSAGTSRGFRTFLFFLVALAAIYAGFLSYAVTSSAAGASASVAGILTGSVAVALAVGWWVTLGQTPRAAWLERDEL
ncbi:MAG: hypothetical protein L3J97_08230, partial [Thermoplasmata archaeon]|nr:hypothetical protein [Thermoplasmata archaeon]